MPEMARFRASTGTGRRTGARSCARLRQGLAVPGDGVVYEGEDDRDEQQAEENRGDQAADDDDGYRRTEARVGADPDGDRQHAGTHRNGGHDDRPRPLAARVEQGVPAVEAVLAAGEDDIEVIDSKGGFVAGIKHGLTFVDQTGVADEERAHRQNSFCSRL